MKAELLESEEVKTFKPVSISLTFESEREIEAFLVFTYYTSANDKVNFINNALSGSEEYDKRAKNLPPFVGKECLFFEKMSELLLSLLNKK